MLRACVLRACVRACVCVCVRACACVCVCVCVCVYLVLLFGLLWSELLVIVTIVVFCLCGLDVGGVKQSSVQRLDLCSKVAPSARK